MAALVVQVVRIMHTAPEDWYGAVQRAQTISEEPKTSSAALAPRVTPVGTTLTVTDDARNVQLVHTQITITMKKFTSASPVQLVRLMQKLVNRPVSFVLRTASPMLEQRSVVHALLGQFLMGWEKLLVYRFSRAAVLSIQEFYPVVRLRQGENV